MVIVYGSPNCSYCVQAKGFLEAKGIQYEYIDITEDEDALSFMAEQKHRTVPQCYENGKHIGGFTQLQEYITHQR